MAVYFIVGKLGSGKSLVAVSRIKERLLNGLPVATNLNIKLHQMVGRDKRNTVLYRIPDKPELSDLLAIGNGNKTYDETKNGLLVLDECGTWFNSRTWADKSRQDVINWFLHARKLGWDIYFIVQDMSIVDKQARLALAEHVVYCKRTDRANIPFVGFIFKLLTGSKLPLPKFHLGLVRYGDSPTAMKVDTWVTIGQFIYNLYDTKQAFSDHYDSGVYSVLPPYYTHGRYSVIMNWRNILRLTKVYWKRFSRPFLFFSASFFTLLISYSFFHTPDLKEDKSVSNEPTKKLKDEFNGYKISSYLNFPGREPLYVLTDDKKKSIDNSVLKNMGIVVKSRGPCESLLVKGDDHVSIFCR